MEKFIKYCCLFIIAIGFTAIGYADDPATGVTPEPSKDQVCPTGQVFDKELKACISKPADDKSGDMLKK